MVINRVISYSGARLCDYGTIRRTYLKARVLTILKLNLLETASNRLRYPAQCFPSIVSRGNYCTFEFGIQTTRWYIQRAILPMLDRTHGRAREVYRQVLHKLLCLIPPRI